MKHNFSFFNKIILSLLICTSSYASNHPLEQDEEKKSKNPTSSLSMLLSMNFNSPLTEESENKPTPCIKLPGSTEDIKILEQKEEKGVQSLRVSRIPLLGLDNAWVHKDQDFDKYGYYYIDGYKNNQPIRFFFRDDVKMFPNEGPGAYQQKKNTDTRHKDTTEMSQAKKNAERLKANLKKFF